MEVKKKTAGQPSFTRRGVLAGAASILGSAPNDSFPSLSIITTGDIRVEASGSTKGKVDLGGPASGGVITLAALGVIQIDGLLLAKSTQVSSFGGSINLLGVCVGGPHDGTSCVGDIPECGDVTTHGTCTGGDRAIQGSANVSSPDEERKVLTLNVTGSPACRPNVGA